MSRHTQGSLAIVGAIAAGIFLVAFVALMVIGQFDVSPAGFLALLVAIAAAVVLYNGFAPKVPAPMPMAKPVAQSAPAPEPEPAPAPEASPAPAPAPATAGDASKPEGLTAPRDGKADDLKQIKGVGPKMEKMLNGMGYWHFDQIAAWTGAEVAWVDANLEGFKGRVSRDSWVDQARVLAAGGETEFSKRVEDGDVY